MEIKCLDKYIYCQIKQVKMGGWPVFKRKLKSAALKIGDIVPALFGFYLLLSLISYLIKTLFNSHGKFYLTEFGRSFLDLIDIKQNYQNDRRNHFLISAYELMDRDLIAASVANNKFVSENPNNSQGYFQMSDILYLQGHYFDSITKIETGLKLQDEQSKRKSLHLLNIKILGNDLSAIGHLCYIDTIVKLGKLDLLSPEKRLVFMTKNAVPNPCYLNYWEEYIDINIIESDEYLSLDCFAREIFENIGCLKLQKGYTDIISAVNLAERSWQDKKLPPLLTLKETDKQRGFRVLEQLSVPRDSWFVALHVREGDQRITRSNADAKIETYFNAIKAITERGGWVIRMGHAGMTPLPRMPGVVDYANSVFKSDWMDVFLWASCQFHIGTASGPQSVPPTFGRPVLYTNCPAIGIVEDYSNSLMLPKLYWSNTENRFFTFREMLDSPIGWTVSRIFDGIDCNIIDNSPEEIEMAVLEMLDKIKQPEDDDLLSDLQIKFNTLRSEYGDTGGMTISETFIQKHSELLS